MFCNRCPTPTPTVMLPDVSCKGKCGKLISAFHKYCSACAQKKHRCEQCGRNVNVNPPAQKKK